MTSGQIRAQIERITTLLVECSLCDEQNFPAVRTSDGHTLITIPGDPDLAVSLKSGLDYREIYERLDKTRAFNFRMLDGAMVQLLYDFVGDNLAGHRLSYFPSPSLEPFQNEPELYEDDEIYADILEKNVVPFPVRFDYSSDEATHVDIRHPKSHLTLGQYRNCRIPVFAPITPILFTRFILMNFYGTAYDAIEEKIEIPLTFFPGCITESEQCIPHVAINRNAA